MYLMEYSFTIVYRPEKQNTNVDSLTRLRTENMIAAVTKEEDITPMVNVIWSQQEFISLQHKDPELSKILVNLNSGDEQYYLGTNDIPYRHRQGTQRYDPVMAPKIIIPEVLHLYHNSLFAAHPGQKKTMEFNKKTFTGQPQEKI